jgi:hypothetical protein
MASLITHHGNGSQNPSAKSKSGRRGRRADFETKRTTDRKTKTSSSKLDEESRVSPPIFCFTLSSKYLVMHHRVKTVPKLTYTKIDIYNADFLLRLSPLFSFLCRSLVITTSRFPMRSSIAATLLPSCQLEGVCCGFSSSDKVRTIWSTTHLTDPSTDSVLSLCATLSLSKNRPTKR